jgi:hypothetical protein
MAQNGRFVAAVMNRDITPEPLVAFRPEEQGIHCGSGQFRLRKGLVSRP